MSDLIFLIRKLDLRSAEEVLGIVKNYYPKKQIKLETLDILNELFEK